ncbi:uncharacterized protein LOC142041118 isoform X1 [Buteo buteo]|uniref:uncharacterized protein LOC142041118 isoform X1 n=1 Tax=Buteo buteo TaxID=30397 RepID=UPI003EBAF038
MWLSCAGGGSRSPREERCRRPRMWGLCWGQAEVLQLTDGATAIWLAGWGKFLLAGGGQAPGQESSSELPGAPVILMPADNDATPRSAGPARNLLQRGVPTGSQPPSGTHLLRRGVLHGLQVEICSTVDLPGLQGDSLPHQGLPHGLQGNLRSGAWSISSPSFFTDLGVRRLVSLTCSHSSLQRLFLTLPTFFLLKNVITEALPLSLIGSALAGGGSVSEPTGVGSLSLEHRGSFQQLLTEATPVTPLATKTLPHNTNTLLHLCSDLHPFLFFHSLSGLFPVLFLSVCSAPCPSLSPSFFVVSFSLSLPLSCSPLIFLFLSLYP